MTRIMDRWARLKSDKIYAAAFTTFATVSRKSIVSDGAGGQTDTYTDYATYPCSFRRSAVRPAEREQSPSIYAFHDHEFWFDRSVVIEQTDRLECEGREFEVLGQGVSSYDLANHVLTVEII